jgi:D-hexose-6-phosphate mutarotase
MASCKSLPVLWGWSPCSFGSKARRGSCRDRKWSEKKIKLDNEKSSVQLEAESFSMVSWIKLKITYKLTSQQ